MNFFVIDSPVMKFLGRLGDIIILNLIFVVTSLPVITIGTALSALYAVAMKLARGEDPSILKEYMKAFKRNMKPATISWLIMSAAGALIFVDFRLAGVFEAQEIIFSNLSCIHWGGRRISSEMLLKMLCCLKSRYLPRYNLSCGRFVSALSLHAQP